MHLLQVGLRPLDEFVILLASDELPTWTTELPHSFEQQRFPQPQP